MRAAWSSFEAEDLPELEPIVAIEIVGEGWRGVTADGQVYNVESGKLPETVMVARAGELIGQRKIIASNVVNVADYLTLFSTAAKLHRQNRNLEALAAIDAAIALVDTTRARFNRGMVLLALGRWPEGFAEFENCERAGPFQRPAYRAALEAGCQPWHGEDISGKRLLLVHDHGLGDTVMMLRFLPMLRAMGAEPILFVPSELTHIAAFGVDAGNLVAANSLKIAALGCDFFTSFLHLLRWLSVTPALVPTGTYVTVNAALVARWRNALPPATRRRVGIAWSVGQEHEDDFPRALPVDELVKRCGDAEIHSLQIQDRTAASEAGVVCHDFADLADCAALMKLMNEVISVDTAAIHLAGAIGHPHATLLLSDWHSWRWKDNPFYPGIRIEASGR
jgi:hypothetical protein